MRARERKARAIVIEVRRPPGVIVVASQAIMRIIAGHMIRVGGVLKIRLMAREAIFRRAGKTAIDVTLGAFDRHMRADQCKGGTAVIERRGFPHTFRMALRAGMRKVAGHMIRIGGALKIRLMA